MKNKVLSLMLICVLILTGIASTSTIALASPLEQAGDSNPPQELVKLIFIHHSTGENWLADGYGNLGLALAENNYYVSDTNYGWGPNGIGDRTDIPDWEEWFRSGDTETYMRALFNEEDQHADYTRTASDPGGENQIIMFKSCFPNSDLEGSPNDLPSSDGWLSVGHAKYVYNEILNYFGQHPEKLFVVITAPPLSDRSNAANARAFNLWLMNDWLDENEYAYNNVAVFDFYNILTGKDAHHTFENGQEVHQAASKDTLAYPSGDDHPSKKGSQKATDEFIPLLNYFFNRWQADNPAPLPDSGTDSTDSEDNLPPAAPPELSGLIDNFEGGSPAGTNGWEAYWDEGTPSSMSCGTEPGVGISGSGLQLDYHITPYSWGTCGLYFDQAQDWGASLGLAFSIHTGQSGGVLHVDLYVEGPEGQESYIYEQSLASEMVEDWVQTGIPWNSFHRVDWEANAGAPFTKQDQVSGLAFGFGTEENEEEGQLWIDDLGWIEGSEQIQEDTVVEEIAQADPGGEESGTGISLPCIGSLALPMSLAGVALVRKKKSLKL